MAVLTTINPIFAVGTDAGTPARVRVYDATTRALKYTLSPFPNSFTGGVRVGVADVTGDGTGDVIVGTGPGGGNRVRVYNGATGNVVSGAFNNLTAFTAVQANGVWVAAGDMNGDGKSEVVVGTDGSTTPRVRVFNGANGAVVRTLTLSDLNISGGVRVGAGDVNGDGKADVIVAGGPGGAARVAAFDGGNGMALYDYFPFDPSGKGGVQVAGGDVDGDGYADVMAGQNSGGGWVKAFGGSNTSSVRTLEAYSAAAGGARVGAVDADADGAADVLTGQGPGGGQVRLLRADGSQIAALNPFGANYTGGVFVAGDSRPAPGGVIIESGSSTFTVVAKSDGVEGGTATFLVTRGGDTTGTASMAYTWGGTSTPNTDWTVSGTVKTMWGPGETTATVTLNLTQDTAKEGPETISMSVTVTPSAPPLVWSTAADNLVDDDAPGGTAPFGGTFEECRDPLDPAPGAPDAIDRLPNTLDPQPILDGSNAMIPDEEVGWFMGARSATGVDLDGSLAFSTCPPFAGMTVSNAWMFGYIAGALGVDLSDMPSLSQGTNLIMVWRCDNPEYFDQSGSTYSARNGAQETLSHNSTNKDFTLTDSSGQQFVFNDFDTSLPSNERGRLKVKKDANSNTVVSATYNGSGQLTQIARPVTTAGTTTVDTTAYTYLTSGVNSGKISTITLTEQVGGGSPVIVRTADVTYHDGTGSGGIAGNLKTIVVKDASTNTLQTSYFRSSTSSTSTGYAGGLKYAVSGAAYDRLKAWCDANSTTVDSATDAQIAPFADLYVEYDSVHRVTRADVQGTGCTACFGGIGSYTYSYATSPFADGYNSWRTKRTETRPDGSVRVVYSNYVNEPVLAVHQEGGQSWVVWYKYDTSGRLIEIAAPSAVSGYDETKADLLNNQSGNYQYLRDSAGLIGALSYYTSTTATDTSAGGVSGYLYQTAIQRGETGSSVLQGTTQYFRITVSGVTVNPVATATRYRNVDGTGGQTTSYAWTWNSGTVMPASLTVVLPTVTTGQNGSGTATSGTVVYDSYGRKAWIKDAGGFITYLSYDDATNALVKVIRDVDTTQTSTFSNLPSGWSTPSGGGLHQTTIHEVDDLGRPTKATDANGNVTYIVYKDDVHEVRTYAGWDSTNNVPTGPTVVVREDRTRGYRETLTMSAAPTVSSGRPTGAESVSNIQSLSREVLNAPGQVVDQDVYFDLTGVTYSQSSVTLGTLNTNYNRTQLFWGKLGELEKTVTPGGTIYRTVFDGQRRPVSSWVGTDDTPTSGFWSPTNTAGTDLVKVSATEYDGGGVGDGLVTKSTQMPGSPYANRDTAFSYDWRDRPVASKAGVEGSESTSVNRPINYSEYDNLSQVIVSEMYDGDTLSITADANGDGVPDRPSSSALRAKSTASSDELGRVYQTNTFSVDPSNGNVSTNSLVSKSWFNSRGLLMRSSSPGGVISKSEFNGLGWTTKSYLTDGGGDSGYSDADDVTSDVVLMQQELTYDSYGNVIFTVSRERFHDETGTGALGTPSTGVKARVTYAASYFDKANRLTDVVDVGTNGGGAYTRPSAPDGRDDTHLVTSYGYNPAGWVGSDTDSRGLVNKTFFNLAGRATKTTENYVDGTVSDADDKTVEYTYDADSHQKTLKALLPGGGYQTTEWVYGVTNPVVSNDILKEMRYPDASSGNASSSEKDSFTVNQLGQVVTKSDRNGNVHTYSYDVLGRQIIDAITILGSGVDGSSRRLETAYDGRGKAYLFTNYDAATGGNVVNQVQREFDGLGQLTREWQAVGGAVNTSTTPSVQYAYSFLTSGTMNHSRLTSITYPNGRVITYNYATGLADNVSRLSSITDGSTTMESYEYLGSGTVVKRGHAEPSVDLTFIKQAGEGDGDAGDKYIGLDRFGRIADNRWRSSSADLERRQYGYDRDSNRLYALNAVESTRSELYAYDGLNRLTSMDRGTLNGTKDGITGSPSRSQDWDYDALGNWDSLTTDGGSAQTRSHNKQNEITSIAGATTPTYDANGNLTTDETGRQFVYDAWNRLVIVKNSGGSTLATYAYDALGRRVRDTRGSTTTDLYYSSAWQVLEERVGSAVKVSYVWSPEYVDAMIARDRDTDGNGSMDERLYAVHDANFNVVAVLDTSGNVVERYAYDAFGVFMVLTPSWASRSSSSYGWVYLHQGMRWDTITGKFHARNREYDPAEGRWTREDPIRFGAGDVNLYCYEHNGPVGTIDPLGLSDTDRRIWICTSGDWKVNNARRWHKFCAAVDSLSPFCESDHTVLIPGSSCETSKLWCPMSSATGEMQKRKLIGPGNSITYLEFSCHAFQFREIVPEQFLGEDIDIVMRKYRQLVAGEPKTPRPTNARLAELWKQSQQFLQDHRDEVDALRVSLRPIAACLAPDAEIRICACDVGKRKQFMMDFSRQMGAKVCANDGSVAGTGTGTWFITNSVGTECTKDARWGSAPGIGQTLNGMRKK